MSFVYKFVPEKTHVFILIPKNGGTEVDPNLGQVAVIVYMESRGVPGRKVVGLCSGLWAAPVALPALLYF
jgi:hypothetical protein